jgi:hypothetical protein
MEETTGVGGFVPSGGTLDALPMPLGSLSTLGLAGPNGTPLIGELPAPADPAGGVSCAYALAGAAKLPSSRAITKAEQRDIEIFPYWWSQSGPVGTLVPRVGRHGSNAILGMADR